MDGEWMGPLGQSTLHPSDSNFFLVELPITALRYHYIAQINEFLKNHLNTNT
jgi:hypothetical protein